MNRFESLRLLNTSRDPEKTKAFLIEGQQIPQLEHPQVIDALLTQRALRIGVMGVLATAPESLPPTERIGVLYVAGLIRFADDLIDSREYPGFTSADKLRDYILVHQPAGLEGVSVEEILYDTCKLFPQDKQDMVVDFFENMVQYHAAHPGVGKGAPGEYTLADVKEYRDATNIPMAEMMGALVGRKSPNILRNSQLFQMFDDATDWKKDVESNTANLYVATAADVWNERGRPPGEDLDYMRYLLAKPLQIQIAGKPIETFQGLRSERMSATRTRYRELLDSDTSVYGGSDHILTKMTSVLIGKS